MPNFSLVSKKSSGFTLIEVMVTLAIIAVLATGLITIIKPQKYFQAANDSKRKSDLVQLQNALQSYYNDKGAYPTTIVGSGTGCASGTECFMSYTTKINGLTPVYTKSLPTDPVSGEACFGLVYVVSSDKQKYDVFAHMDSSDDQDALKAKPAPNMSTLCTQSVDGKSCTTGATGFCAPPMSYNYWVSNP